jgi:ring-1,2-phenylacetyl-CoA epoxidase subunit PaaC
MSDTNRQQALLELVLRLGDNSLVNGHRLSEWCSKGPILEEDLALANMKRLDPKNPDVLAQ